MTLMHVITAYGAVLFAAFGAAGLIVGFFLRRRTVAMLGLLSLAVAGPLAGLAWFSGWWSLREMVPFSDAAERTSARHGEAGLLGAAVVLGTGLCALGIWNFLRHRGRIARIVVLLVALLGLAGVATLGQAFWLGRTLHSLQSGNNPEDLPPPPPPDHLVIGQPPGPFEED